MTGEKCKKGNKTVARKSEANKPVEKSRSRWEDINMDLTERCDVVEWIQMMRNLRFLPRDQL
jgi:hypothetical protein